MAVYIYPSQSVVASNPSVGLTGDPTPLSATLVAGDDGTDLIALSVNSAGALALPQGASTAAKQDTGNASLASIDGKVATETTLADIKTSVQLIDNAIAGNEMQVDVVSSALPTGAATEATLGDIKTSVQLIDNAISGNEMQVDIKSIEGLEDTGNSTTTPLGANGVFTGTWRELTNWNAIGVGVYSDQASATDGLSIEFSEDGVNVRHAHKYTIAGGGNGYGYNLTAEFKYFRVKYTNSTVAQTTLVITTMLKATSMFPSSYKITEPINDNTQALMTRAIITGYSSSGGGSYHNVKVTPSGALAVEVGTSALPTGAATEATLADVRTSVQLLDNAIAGNEMQVDVVTSALPAGAATEATLATRASEATLATRASEATLATRASEATLATRASEATLATRATEATLATRASEATLAARLSGSLVPTAYNEIALTYVTAGNGLGQIQTAVFKLASSTVATLTLTYDSSNRITNVVKT